MTPQYLTELIELYKPRSELDNLLAAKRTNTKTFATCPFRYATSTI